MSLDADGRVAIRGASDAQITAGFAGLIARGLSGLEPRDVLAISDDVVADLGIGPSALPRSRANGFRNMLETVKKQCRLLLAEGGVTTPPSPSLIVTADGVEAVGSFARAQAEYLEPNADAVDALVAELEAKKIGIVAHFYMDPQVQGVLMAAAKRYEHVFISDSLVMADAAVKMVREGGCESVCVLGVDFMSENVRAILDDAGLESAKVYRMAAEDIGCSLAEAAQDKKYYDYLAEADGVENAVHVIYINTALDTKANANAVVPTITCTSSNVVQTVLTAAAQVPGVNVFYGPDTYMGGNLAELFTMMSTWSDEDVAAVHPAHTQATIKDLLPRLRYFQDGTCMVHHMFGGDVCDAVRKFYGDAYQTAHFEVPGEMFKLAMEAKRERDMGVVGSTKNILDYVCEKIDEAVARNLPAGERLSFVLGTETGMVTSIVRAAQAKLVAAKAAGVAGVEAEIVFPVSADAVAPVAESESVALGGIAIVPGPAGGEGLMNTFLQITTTVVYYHGDELARRAHVRVRQDWHGRGRGSADAVRAQEVRSRRGRPVDRRARLRADSAHARLSARRRLLRRVRGGHHHPGRGEVSDGRDARRAREATGRVVGKGGRVRATPGFFC